MSQYSLPAQDLSTQGLVHQCFLTGSEEAWAEFIARFNRLIAAVVFRTARRWGASTSEGLDDLMQDVYLKLCAERTRLLERFQAEHPEAFYGYLKVVTANLVQDHFKAMHARKRGAGAKNLSLDRELPVHQASSLELSILLEQIDAVLSGCEFSNEERVLFWLYYRQGFTAAAISSLPTTRLSVKGVESLLGRMARMVREKLAGNSVSAAADHSRIGPARISVRSCGRRAKSN